MPLADKYAETEKLIRGLKVVGQPPNQNADLDELLTTIDTEPTNNVDLEKIGISVDEPTTKTGLNLDRGDINFIARELTHAQAEVIAQSTIETFNVGCAKIRSKADDIVIIRQYFKRIRNHTELTLSGCRSFEEFCIKRLHRTSRAVRYMLDGRPSQSKRKQPGERIIGQDCWEQFTKLYDLLIGVAAECIAHGSKERNGSHIFYEVAMLGSKINDRVIRDTEAYNVEKAAETYSTRASGPIEI